MTEAAFFLSKNEIPHLAWNDNFKDFNHINCSIKITIRGGKI
jgi:hypothetical protein